MCFIMTKECVCGHTTNLNRPDSKFSKLLTSQTSLARGGGGLDSMWRGNKRLEKEFFSSELCHGSKAGVAEYLKLDITRNRGDKE